VNVLLFRDAIFEQDRKYEIMQSFCQGHKTDARYVFTYLRFSGDRLGCRTFPVNACKDACVCDGTHPIIIILTHASEELRANLLCELAKTHALPQKRSP